VILIVKTETNDRSVNILTRHQRSYDNASLSDFIRTSRLKFFGHVARDEQSLEAAIWLTTSQEAALSACSYCVGLF